MSQLIKPTIIKLTALALTMSAAFTTSANALDEVSAAVKNSNVDINLRYRLESVDDDIKGEDSLGSTLKSRITVTTAPVYGFNAKVEVDNVTYIGNDKFNSTDNGKTDHPTIADPDGTEINQAFLKYTGGFYDVTAGRQRINLDDQRFIGGVAWRQNEQTFDGYRIKVTPMDKLTLDASYVYNVNRIFGEDNDAKSDLHGDVYLANAKYAFTKNHSLTAFYYEMEFDNSDPLSNSTYGATYNGAFNVGNTGLDIKAGYASQEDAGDNANEYEADYIVFDANFKFEYFTLGGGYELLGSDNNVGFQTPLATAHKFQGFADMFLATPEQGIEDIYLKASTKIMDVKLAAAYHNYESDEDSEEYGDEVNFTASYQVTKQVNTLFKAAYYNADDYGNDTAKFWFMTTANF